MCGLNEKPDSDTAKSSTLGVPVRSLKYLEPRGDAEGGASPDRDRSRFDRKVRLVYFPVFLVPVSRREDLLLVPDLDGPF